MSRNAESRKQKRDRQAKKAEKIAKRNAAKALRDRGLNVRVTCQAICGCCEAVFYFKDRARAEEACKKASLKHADITDDRGETEKVDGFYGFNIEDV